MRCALNSCVPLLAISMSACTLLPTAPPSTVQRNADAMFEDLKKETTQRSTSAGGSYDTEAYLIVKGGCGSKPGEDQLQKSR